AELPQVVWWEALLAAYCTAGLGVVVALGEWAAVPFQVLFAAGFALVTVSNFRQVVAVRQAAPASASSSA
ncbi:MAG: glucosyltransferase, partial [Salinibacter sp.]